MSFNRLLGQNLRTIHFIRRTSLSFLQEVQSCTAPVKKKISCMGFGKGNQCSPPKTKQNKNHNKTQGSGYSTSELNRL